MIDDVALVGGPCAGVVTCSFRVDMCGWTIPKETLPWLQAAHITSRNFSSSSGEMFMYADTNQLEFEQFIMASDLVQTAGNFELTLETVNHVVGVCIFDIYTLSSDESSLIYRMPEDELNNTQWSITKIYFRYDGNFQIGIVLRSQLSDCFFAIRDLKLTQLVTNQQSEATFRTVAHDELSSQPNTFAPAAAVHFKNNCLLLVLMLSTSFLTLI
ncbi:hypothetical protein HDE_09764 [Halotydeus destructor]|nr:hypothetical protein HDE_09764 [Halotydeus destructor]